ncbi:MAG: hypothetical protein KJ017_09945 [Alphaproteobacteria bacterium]|nr:hypothetical protein [Alphaproteobacteria bacterium]
MRTLVIFMLTLITTLSVVSLAYAEDAKPEKKSYCGQPGIPDPKSPEFQTFDNVDRVAILFWITGPFEVDEKELPEILQRENLKTLVKGIFEERYKELDGGIIPTNKSWCFNRKNQPVMLYDYNEEKEADKKFYDVIKDEGTLAVHFYVQFFDIDRKNEEDEKTSKASDVVTMQVTIRRTGYRLLDKMDFKNTPLTASIHANNNYLAEKINRFIRGRIF